MKKLILLVITLILFASCTKKAYYSSSWQDGQTATEGKLAVWSEPLRFYDQSTGISYSISNDLHNLYLRCSVTDEYMQTKLLRSGLQFGIDTLGKKSFAVALKFPFGNTLEKGPNPNINQEKNASSNSRNDRSSFKLRLIAEATEIQLTGFKASVGRLVSVSPPNNEGIAAAINFDPRGTMNYEVVIPFATFYKRELTPSDSNRLFNYQIKIDPVANQGGQGNNQGMRGGGSRGGGMRGGMGGGGMRGGGGMGGGGMRGGGGMGGNRMSGENGGSGYQRNSSGTSKTTVKLKLAYK